MPAFDKKQMKRGKHRQHLTTGFPYKIQRYVVILSPSDDAEVKLSENWNLNWYRYNITETGEEASAAEPFRVTCIAI